MVIKPYNIKFAIHDIYTKKLNISLLIHFTNETEKNHVIQTVDWTCAVKLEPTFTHIVEENPLRKRHFRKLQYSV